MGCPDAVRAELLHTGGVLQVKYQADQNIFRIQFESVLVNLETIFAVVFAAGRKMGQEYLPELIEETFPSRPEAAREALKQEN